ncbi:gamma-interferon-inducible lysosomal thiol reductase-like [Euwallacea fornicatus]|uniref:gamma-interferon-inducible lysosomal thiol reductase-like n=1 Tax=Euwallacea fornicatus TaxID=995702 RepID=UPI0033901B66
MKSLWLLLAVLSVAQGKTLRAEEETLKVQIFYETLCPDSIAFITEHLYPTYIVLKKWIDLELIPWGHASEQIVNDTKIFICQHGPAECHGNIVHACAINLTTVEKSTEFVFCSEKSQAPSDDIVLKQCAETTEIVWNDLEDCISNGKGADLLSENGKETDLVDPVFVPTIIFNGIFNQRIQNESLKYFKAVVCSLIGYPPQCQF